MASLYQISNDILDLFYEIENRETDWTDEQAEEFYKKFSITENELKSKLTNYYQAIQNWSSDMKECKEEEKRIAAVRKKYESRIERLKSAMLGAVQTFGSKGKTNKFIELPTVRLYTRGSKAVQVNDVRIEIFLTEFEQIIRELYKNGCLETGEDVDYVGILDVINANVKAAYGDEFELFTLEDFNNLELEFKVTATIPQLFKTKGKLLEAYCYDPMGFGITNNTPKEAWKNAIQIAADNNRDKITMAEIVTNESIQMK